MKLKFPRIKKWKKIEDIDRLQKAWDQKYAAKGHQTQTESDFIDATNEIKYRGTGVERFEKFKKVDATKQTIANVYGKKPTEGSFKYSELSPEEDLVLGQARILGDKVQTRHIKKAQAAYTNIARKSGTKFVVSAGKIKPVIVRTKPGLGKNEEFYTNYTKAMTQARKLNQPSQILTTTKIVDSKFIGPRLPKYKGIGKPTSGEELKLKYDKVAIRAITSGKGAEATFIKNSMNETGVIIKNVSDKEKKFMKMKRGGISEDDAFLMGFPAKSPGGQFEPFPGLDKFKPFKDPANRLSDTEEKALAYRSTIFGRTRSKDDIKLGRPGKTTRIFEKEFYDKSREQGYKLGDDKGYWQGGLGKSKEKYIKHKGELIKGKRTTWFKKDLNIKSKPTYSSTTKALYPHLSKDEGWFKQIEKAYKKKKGKTPFDF